MLKLIEGGISALITELGLIIGYIVLPFSLAIFMIDQVTGLLTPVGWESTQGRSPRFFGLNRTGAFLYVANQDSDSIVVFRVDQTTGRLMPTGHVVETGSPSSIALREASH